MTATCRLAVAAAISAIGVVLGGCGFPATAPPGSPDASGAAPAVSENNPAGDIPDNQAFVPFTPAGGFFMVSVPEGWARTTEGAATIFTDKLNAIRIETRPTAAAPNTESVSVYELPGIASSTPNFRVGTVTAVRRNAGQVMLITYQGTSPPNAVSGKTEMDAFERYEYLARRPSDYPDIVRTGRRRQRRPVADHHRLTAMAVTAVPAAVEARSLYRFYRAGDEETLALQGVSLTVRSGEFVAVAGPSGSGKSTLLACLAGMDNPDGGSVRIAGERISHRPEPEQARIRGCHIGMLFQDSNLFDHLTVAENVAIVRALLGRTHIESFDVLGQLDLSDRASAYPGQLSGGELARAGLAVALANAPTALLADEPTGELDTVTEALVLGLLSEAAARGTAIVVASHSPAIAAAAARVVRLDDGRVC
jgi:putative ABC transport system ATP-binding protein